MVRQLKNDQNTADLSSGSINNCVPRDEFGNCIFERKHLFKDVNLKNLLAGRLIKNNKKGILYKNSTSQLLSVRK